MCVCVCVNECHFPKYQLSNETSPEKTAATVGGAGKGVRQCLTCCPR